MSGFFRGDSSIGERPALGGEFTESN
jgi:hypothetical protein